MGKRVLLFVLTNLLVAGTLCLIAEFSGANNYLESEGIDWTGLIAMCLVWGFAGSFISLALSRFVAKTFLKVKVVSATEPGNLQWLASMVERVAMKAGLPKPPQVGVYRSDEVNAFATGPTQTRALVAFSSALIQEMDRQSIEAVAAHEIAHITNGDMVTMTLLQGVINSFVMFFAYIIATAASQAAKGRSAAQLHHITYAISSIVLSLLGMIVTSRFSRAREFRADSEGARLSGKENMIKALQNLQVQEQKEEAAELPQAAAALGISNRRPSFLAKLLSTHPPLEERIKAIQANVGV